MRLSGWVRGSPRYYPRMDVEGEGGCTGPRAPPDGMASGFGRLRPSPRQLAVSPKARPEPSAARFPRPPDRRPAVVAVPAPQVPRRVADGAERPPRLPDPGPDPGLADRGG